VRRERQGHPGKPRPPGSHQLRTGHDVRGVPGHRDCGQVRPSARGGRWRGHVRFQLSQLPRGPLRIDEGNTPGGPNSTWWRRTTSVREGVITMILPEENGLIPVHVELWYDDQWSDITPDVDVSQAITIRRARDDHQSSPSPASCRFTSVNRDGKYSARNPLSPLYGKIGRNTPVRVRVGDHPLALQFDGVGDSNRPSYVITPAKSEFNVPVLDLRVDMEPESWTPGEWRNVVTRTV